MRYKRIILLLISTRKFVQILWKNSKIATFWNFYWIMSKFVEIKSMMWNKFQNATYNLLFIFKIILTITIWNWDKQINLIEIIKWLYDVFSCQRHMRHMRIVLFFLIQFIHCFVQEHSFQHKNFQIFVHLHYKKRFEIENSIH